jgi:ParB/RepB/Spo0J family partition protein
MSGANEPLGGAERVDQNTSPESTMGRVQDKIARRGLHSVEKRAVRLTRLTVEYVPIDTIKPNTYNPNRQDPETLELLIKSITEDGFTQPIIAHAESRQIVDGEHRWRAARKMGMTEIPVTFVSMTDEQMRIATLRHNRARGSEDIELSTEVLRDLKELGALEWAADSLMYTDAELNDLLDVIPAPEALAGEEFSEAWTPEAGQKTDTQQDASTHAITQKDSNGSVATTAMTRRALDAARERDEAVKAATTERERHQIQTSMARPFRLQFTFTGDEADLVNAVLGDEPAEALLDICRELDPGPVE